MKKIFLIIFLIFGTTAASQEGNTLLLQPLIDEALENNRELEAALNRVIAARAVIPQKSSLADPEIAFKFMEMPGLKPNEAMMQNIEFMQMIELPNKLSTKSKIAELEADRLKQLYNEKTVEIVAKVKMMFYDLWVAQQNLLLNRENTELLKKFLDIANTRYIVAKATQQDILKTQVELVKLENERLTLKQNEETALAMLASLLNRDILTFKGTASAIDKIQFNYDIKVVEEYALRNCSKLRADSLMLEQDKSMLKMAKLEYLPDFKLGVEYASSPMTGFRGWSLMAGMTLPFSFWTISKANGRVDEAEANVRKSTAMYFDERNMLLSKVRELYTKASSFENKYALYESDIIPLSEQTLFITTTNYQTGTSDFLTLIDTYRMHVMFKMEKLMIRMQFEQALAELEEEIGCRDIEEIIQ